jgi:hypothetical protein
MMIALHIISAILVIVFVFAVMNVFILSGFVKREDEKFILLRPFFTYSDRFNKILSKMRWFPRDDKILEILRPVPFLSKMVDYLINHIHTHDDTDYQQYPEKILEDNPDSPKNHKDNASE